jgi:hypothetical protein
MPRVLMHFDRYNGFWWFGFLEADCKTSIGRPNRRYRFVTLDSFRWFVIRCNPEDMADFERSVRAWTRGSNYVNVTDEHYEKLRS